ncbi:MAG: aminopeptidase P family protein [Pseudomonadota bacterium]
MNPIKRIQYLRSLFTAEKIRGYIIPSTDEYQSEYTSHYARRLEYITGFTGSNGVALVLEDKLLFFTDGRYKAQAGRELSLGWEIFDLRELRDISPQGEIGYDPMLFTEVSISLYSHLNLRLVEPNLVDTIWEDKPPRPSSAIYDYPLEYAGVCGEDKIAACRDEMRKHNASYCLLTASDSICWLLNIRASDIEFCPLLLSYLLIGLDKLWIFTEKREWNALLQNNEFQICNSHDIRGFLQNLSAQNHSGKVMLDKATCPIGLSSLIKNPVYSTDPCILPKACKNNIEIKHSADVHTRDGVALCETIAWIYDALEQNKTITEYDIGLCLSRERQKQQGYISDSFPAIVGYQGNGAIIHYRASKPTAKTIQGSGLLLIDSGGHYFGGTTDVTRVIAIGKPSIEQKQRYTEVLKGHISLAKQKFPSGTTGGALDILARQYLWQNGLDYAHGTGHGVGNALSVHEGPQRIGQQNLVQMQKGMIISNEPGYYKDDEYGIRIENLMALQDEGEKFLKFDTLSLAPYCSDLIILNMLSAEELEWLEDYYSKIRIMLNDKLSPSAQKVLERELKLAQFIVD